MCGRRGPGPCGSGARAGCPPDGARYSAWWSAVTVSGSAPSRRTLPPAAHNRSSAPLDRPGSTGRPGAHAASVTRRRGGSPPVRLPLPATKRAIDQRGWSCHAGRVRVRGLIAAFVAAAPACPLPATKRADHRGWVVLPRGAGRGGVTPAGWIAAFVAAAPACPLPATKRADHRGWVVLPRGAGAGAGVDRRVRRGGPAGRRRFVAGRRRARPATKRAINGVGGPATRGWGGTPG